MGFFEESFARCGRAIDDTFESLGQAMREGGSSGDGVVGTIKGLWRGLCEWFEGEDARGRRLTAISIGSGLCLLVLGMAAWRAIRPDPPPPLTEAQTAAIAAARRQVELQNFRERQTTPKTPLKAPPRAAKPTPRSPAQNTQAWPTAKK